MFSAHFDESGTLDTTHAVLTVAGFVSSVKKWGRFELDWKKILKDEGLPDGTIFHMNLFARGLPPYEQWAGQPKRRAQLVSALVGCTKRNVNKAFSCSIALRDWERLNERYCVVEHLGYPYPLCGRHCVAQVMKWARNKGVAQAHVELFFERGATHRGQLEKLLLANDGIGPLFKSKEEMIQFQAADLLAWKSHKVMEKVFEPTFPGDASAYNSVRRSLAGMESIPHEFGAHDYGSLNRLAQQQNVPLRPKK